MTPPVPVTPAFVEQWKSASDRLGGCGDCMLCSKNTYPTFNHGSGRYAKRPRRAALAALIVITSGGLLGNGLLSNRLSGEDIERGVRPTSAQTQSTSHRAASLRETPTVAAIRRASPAVVNLHGQKAIRNTAASMAGANLDRQVNGMGTGVIIDPRGYVITNYHVVEDVAEINVTMQDGKTTRADLVASDPASDLALVQIRSNEPLPTIPRGHSDDLMVGETVIAIGNAFGYVHTSTTGIISALHRDVPVNEVQEYRDLIQTSAGINPGNSGGPLLNIDGEMIGVNVAVRVNAQQIAFAIPIDQVLQTVTKMLQRDNDRRLVIGMAAELDPRGGLKVVNVATGSSADRCGIKRGDRIVSINSEVVIDELQLALSVLENRSAKEMRIEFERDDQSYETFLAATASTSQLGDVVTASAWQVIGITAKPVGDASTRKLNARLKTNYKGGLVVETVRPGSAADQQGIMAGDILLGIHSWQTASMDDLAGILEQPEIQRGVKAKFYLIRRDQTLFGHLQIAAQPNSMARR